MIGLIFFILLISHSWQETKLIFRTLNWPLFLLSIIIATLDNVLFSVLFQQLLTKYGFYIDYLRTGQMFFFGQIAKYIPGRFWGVFYHATFFQRPGATKDLLFANLDLTSISMLRNTFIAVFLVLFQWNSVLAFFVAFLGTGLFWFFTRSYWITYFFYLLFGKASSKFDKTQCHSKLNNPLVILIGSLSWITFLLANFLIMRSAFNFTTAEAMPYIAYFEIAWVVGVLSFIVPAGIGVREITFIFLAQTFNQNQAVSVEVLSAIAIVYRFWQILLEFGSLGIGLILKKIEKKLRGSVGCQK